MADRLTDLLQGVLHGAAAQYRRDFGDGRAENDCARVLEFFLNPQHELQKKRIKRIHGPTHIAQQDESGLAHPAVDTGEFQHIHAVPHVTPE